MPLSIVASRLDHVAMISDEPLHVTCVGAWKGSGLVLLGLLRLSQIALLSSCRSSAMRPWFQNEKTPAGGMPTEVAEGIMWIRKPASCPPASIGGGYWCAVASK